MYEKQSKFDYNDIFYSHNLKLDHNKSQIKRNQSQLSIVNEDSVS